MGGLLTVQQFLSRFPQVDVVNDPSFHDAWVTGTSRHGLVLLCMYQYHFYDTKQTLTLIGLMVGTWNLGCIVSAVATIFVGDLLGRRRTLILGLTFWVIGEIIQTSCYSFAQFIVGRAVAGFGKHFYSLLSRGTLRPQHR